MLPTTTETPEQLRKRLVADYNAHAGRLLLQGLTDLAASYRALAAGVAALELGQ